MKLPFSAPSARARIESGALFAVVSLLGLLAVMQHRWLRTIAQAEHLKLTEESSEKATAIAREVDRELTRAFLELRVDKRIADRRDGVAFAERFLRWRTESNHAALVKEVYVAERKAKGPSTLLRFDAPSSTFVEEPWPGALAKVRDTLEPHGPEPLSESLDITLPPVMAEVPALISPVLNVLVASGGGPTHNSRQVKQISELFAGHPSRGPVQILLLDPVYLREALVGGLADSRIGSSGSFFWSVVRTADKSRIAGASWTPEAGADATVPLLRLRFDDLERSLLRTVLPRLSEAVSESSVRVVVQVGRPGGSRARSQEQVSSVAASLRGMAPGLEGPGAGTGDAHLATDVAAGRTEDAPWTLLLRHKEGSIDAAVRAQQLRNTALSGSILAVLGFSAGLVFFSARKLRAIATQQVEFVAAVSHELRTPLAVIRSAADNLADGVVHEKDQTRRYGALIREESVRLTDMVEHVLEFAGADSPGRSARGPIDATEAARAAVRALEALIAERGASVTMEAGSEPLSVRGDMSHLTRAIANLLGNALKYGGDRTRVRLRVRPVSTGVEISVSDSGAGLIPAEIPHLFEPFYRGRRESEAQIPGSGLGLALVNRVVASHGGQVSASNEPQGGARFTITLPKA